MSGATTAAAIGGAAVVGAAASSSAASKASKSANAATAASSEASAAQIAFSREQYEDWKAVFGDVQDNLSAYYKNLTPASIEVAGTQAIKQEYAAVSKNLTQALAQRGIASSGLEAQAMTDLATKQAQDTALVRVQAPVLAAQEKMKFLALGLGQGTAAAANVGSAYQTQATLASQQAGMYNQQAAQASAGVGSALGSGINAYMTNQALQNQNLLYQNALTTGGNSALNYNVNTGGALTNAYFGNALS